MTMLHVQIKLNNFTNALCHQGNITLKWEWCSPSRPTADSTHRYKTRRSSDVVNGLSKLLTLGEELRSPLAPLLKKILSLGPTNTMYLVSGELLWRQRGSTGKDWQHDLFNGTRKNSGNS